MSATISGVFRWRRNTSAYDHVQPIRFQAIDHAVDALWIVGCVTVYQHVNVSICGCEEPSDGMSLTGPVFFDNQRAGCARGCRSFIRRTIVTDPDLRIRQFVMKVGNYLGDRERLILTRYDHRDSRCGLADICRHWRIFAKSISAKRAQGTPADDPTPAFSGRRGPPSRAAPDRWKRR